MILILNNWQLSFTVMSDHIPEMKQLKRLVPDQDPDKHLKKIKGRSVHPLVMDHDAAAIRRYRLLELIEQIAPA
jgi:hypothetical protein